MIGSIILGLVAVVLIVMGYQVWKNEKITLFHDYHYDKVAEEDKKAFCTISGIGIFIVGMGMLISAVLVGIIDSMWSSIPFAAGFVFGLIMVIYAGIKYNR